MGKKFNIPSFYKSSLITTIKRARSLQDHYKRDLSPSLLDLGEIRFKIARHFGFCYGVENAIEITYRAIEENPDKKIFLISEMIHNPHVNSDLQARGVRFLMKTNGEYLIPFEELQPEDIVIIPAFGTTDEMLKKLTFIGIDPQLYNATCPFVEKVWKRSESLGEKNYTIIIHGKQKHEETRATFSHARKTAPSLIIRNIEEAKILAGYIKKEIAVENFEKDFQGRYSENFSPKTDLMRIGVVNQTTMLATETKIISDILFDAIEDHYGKSAALEYFANTRDTLCYATAENQEAMNHLIESGGDIAIIVGGYNSSNTSHLVELCENKLPSYYIKDAEEILDKNRINHLNIKKSSVILTENWLPKKNSPIDILITAGASCPDMHVDKVIQRISELFGLEKKIGKALQKYITVIKNAK